MSFQVTASTDGGLLLDSKTCQCVHYMTGSLRTEAHLAHSEISTHKNGIFGWHDWQRIVTIHP